MESKVINLLDIAVEPQQYGPAFSLESPDLDCNFLRFDAGEGVPLHINAQVDVAGIVLEGEGFLQVDGQQHLLAEGD
ncbi:MAG: cupin domain-containing protein, partial [Anaerolineae bacterium]